MISRRYRSIQTTIALAFGALVLAMALVMAVLSYTFTQDAVKQNSQDYTELLVGQIQTNIDSYITYMENVAEVVRRNEQVQRFLDPSRPAGSPTDEHLRDRIAGFLSTIARTRTDISLILVVGRDGRVVAQDPRLKLNRTVNISTERWFLRAQDVNGQPVISSPHVENVIAGTYRWVITLSRTINDVKTGRPLGVLLVDLNFSVINDLVNNITLGSRGYVFIVEPDGGIVYHPRQELIYSGLEQEPIQEVLSTNSGSFTVHDGGRERMYTVAVSRRTGWRTVGVNYVSELVQNRGTIQRYYLFWTLVCLAFAILMAVVISHRISSPIMRLRGSMQAVEQGNFDVTVDAAGNNEIGAVARDFNIMIFQIKDLMRRNAAEQEQKRKSELLALQNQITPHFLYNTLDSVIWMAEGRQYSNVIQTVSALARLLRLSISNGDELISIRDEVEHIKSYLIIQKLRYRDKLDFSIEVEDTVLALRTPKVILQPLVENAIYHGIKNKNGTGQVQITGRRFEGGVHLCVADDGVGMSEQQRRSILTVTSSESRSQDEQNGAGRLDRVRRRGSRVGVRNVHERIQLYFGANYGLSFSGNGHQGTIVTIHLPVVETEEKRDE